MKPGVVPLPDLQLTDAQRASEVMRTAQQHELERKHAMIPLFIQKEKLLGSENQVLVTPNYHLTKKIFLIIHDP